MNRGRANSSVAAGCTLLCLLLLPMPLFAGEIIDRMLATVNNDVILASDLELALRFEALAQSKPAQVTAAQRGEELQRLIDQRLLFQQMRRMGYTAATDEEIADALAALRASIPAAAADDGWRRALAQAGLTAQEVRRRLAMQIEVTRFVDQRFRPGIRVDRSEVQSYYDQALVPELRAKGLAVPPFAQVEAKITDLLVEKSIDEQLNSWLKTLRAESSIHLFAPAATLEASVP